MDESTNHLDLRRIGFLQTWLATGAQGRPVVVASHDRAFLDAVTTRTLLLREPRSQVLALPYSRARAALAEVDAAEGRRFANDMTQALQMRGQAAKLKNIGINSGSDLLVVKTKQLQERADRMEEAARPVHQERGAGAIRLAKGGTPSKALAAFDDVAVKAPDGRLLFRTGKLWIHRGDRIVVLGPNDNGKSQFLPLVRRALREGVSGITVAPTVVEGWSDQNLAQFDAYPTAWAAVTERFDVGDHRARGLLRGQDERGPTRCQDLGAFGRAEVPTCHVAPAPHPPQPLPSR
jgi:ATPase subunit of ABC transporter with duplicated ATPase domains